MKLIYCPYCNDIFKLNYDLRMCVCGNSYGEYYDRSDIRVGGEAIVLAIHNGSLMEALGRYIKAVPNKKYRWWATPFKSWVMVEKNCPSVHRYECRK